jgi:trans-aconitate 2-methyltransferase
VSRVPLDWDAAAYDRVADPQEQWAREIVARLDLEGDEVVLDAGCGSGRITRLLLQRLPAGRVVAVDASPRMVDLARATLADCAAGRVEVHRQDLLELDLVKPVDVIFSCAVFHHIHDHDRLFGKLRGALREDGRLVAQCGGEGNIDSFRKLADSVAARAPYAEHLAGMDRPWHYATVADTKARLRAAGFREVECWTQLKPTTPNDARGFSETVLLNYHLERLRTVAPPDRADDLARAFVDDVLAEAGEPLALQYVRLNIQAIAGFGEPSTGVR